MRRQEELPTIWEAPEALWAELEAILNELDPPNQTGRPRADARRQFNGMLFRLRTGCPWNRLSKEYGSDRTIHRTFQRWVALGVFQRLWAHLVERATAEHQAMWERQAVDTAMGKARSGGTSWGRTRRTERSGERSAASSSTPRADR